MIDFAVLLLGLPRYLTQNVLKKQPFVAVVGSRNRTTGKIAMATRYFRQLFRNAVMEP